MSTALLIFDPKSLWVFWGEGAVGLKSKTKRGVFGFKMDSIVKKEIKRGVFGQRDGTGNAKLFRPPPVNQFYLL